MSFFMMQGKRARNAIHTYVWMKIQIQMYGSEPGYEYIYNRMQIIELKMRLNIQFDGYAYNPAK